MIETFWQVEVQLFGAEQSPLSSEQKVLFAHKGLSNKSN